MIVNFAERAHNHNWDLDPVTRSLLDTDFYKLLMLQFIWKHFPKTHASFDVFNRTDSMRPADLPARGVDSAAGPCAWASFSKIGAYLAGRQHLSTGAGESLNPPFWNGLSATFALRLQALGQGRAVSSVFDGPWTATTMWELYSLSIINELETRASLKRLSEIGLDIFYARGENQAVGEDRAHARRSGSRVADFGTRRRHSFLWQEYAVEAMAANLGRGFLGTSNAFLAYKHDMEASAPTRMNSRWRLRRWPTMRCAEEGAISRAGAVAADLPG